MPTLVHSLRRTTAVSDQRNHAFVVASWRGQHFLTPVLTLSMSCTMCITVLWKKPSGDGHRTWRPEISNCDWLPILYVSKKVLNFPLPRDSFIQSFMLLESAGTEVFGATCHWTGGVLHRIQVIAAAEGGSDPHLPTVSPYAWVFARGPLQRQCARSSRGSDLSR